MSFTTRSLCCATLAVSPVAPVGAQPVERPRASGASAAAAAWQRHAARSHAALSALNGPDRTALPPPPAGVTDLAFGEIFGPVGDRGLEYSAKLRSLDGRMIRLVGYMVREQERALGLFRFAGWPLSVESKGGCATDPVPVTAVHVVVPSAAARPVPYRPGRMVLCGRLEIGPRLEADGRNSAVRLVLEASSAALLAASTEMSAAP